MAEKGIIVDDADSGESVACRDAIQQDDGSNNRIIQLVDKAARPIVYQRNTPLRTGVTAPDDFDIDPLSSGIVSNLLDVSDAESCVFWAVVTVGTSVYDTMGIHITPIIVSEDSTPVAVCLLSPFQLLPVFPAKMINTSISSNNRIQLSGSTIPTIVRSFPTFGAKKIGFHVNFAISNATTSVDLFAAPSSCCYRDSGIDSDITSGTWGISFGL